MISSLKGFFFFFVATTSVFLTLSFSQLVFNHVLLPDPKTYLSNCTISKEKNCVVNYRTFDLSYPGTWKKAAHESLHGTLKPEKQYTDLLILQYCLFGSGSLAAQLCFSTSTVSKETPPKRNRPFPSSPGLPPWCSYKNQLIMFNKTWYFLQDLPLD